jgi:glucosylceramidase
MNPTLKSFLVISALVTLSLTYSCRKPIHETLLQIEKSIPVRQLKTADIYITAMNTDYRLTGLPSVTLKESDPPDEFNPAVMIDPHKTFQTIEGFGGALTDAAAETFYKLPGEKQDEIITAYFNADRGIGYTLCRTHINSCDFSSESYDYAPSAGDTMLSGFNVDHDKKFRIPLIKRAQQATGNALKLFASPWSPPAWMKTNNSMVKGGKVKPVYYQTWANYYIKFMQAYQKEGIPVWGLTVQNEPLAVQTWESCIYSAEDEKNFVKNYLGPTLHHSEFAGVRLMIWDHNRGLMVRRAQEILQDSAASGYVWGTAFHWYTGDHFENVKIMNEAYPDKKLLFSEGCTYPYNFKNIGQWQWGETYGRSMMNDLNNGTVAWVDWNILVDETGGPNHVHNYCFAPVIGDTRSGKVYYMNSYYYLGHFSKFIRPGAKRIACSSNNDDLLATAFLNPDGTVAVVSLNLTDKSMDFAVWIDGNKVSTRSLAHSIITLVLK